MKEMALEEKFGYYGELLKYHVISFAKDMYDAKLILDAGCGDLSFSKIVANNTKSLVISIDINESIIRKSIESQRMENIIPIVCDVRKLPFRSRIFEGIIVINMLHHLPNLFSLSKALYELRKVCKINARMFIKENVSNNPFRLLFEILYNHMPMTLKEAIIVDKCYTKEYAFIYFTTEYLLMRLQGAAFVFFSRIDRNSSCIFYFIYTSSFP